jgi:hypothetical protein
MMVKNRPKHVVDTHRISNIVNNCVISEYLKAFKVTRREAQWDEEPWAKKYQILQEKLCAMKPVKY